MHQSKNIRMYASYLEDKVETWRQVKIDFGESRTDFAMKLVTDTNIPSLLTNLEALQKHLDSCLNMKLNEVDVDNEVTLYCLRLMIRDCLKLFQLLNHGIIFMLKHYFEMSMPNATKALNVYRKFTEQAQNVTDYLKVGKLFESYLGFNIPSLKHAPVSLAEGLEEYLKNPNKQANQFDFNSNANSAVNDNNNNNSNGFDIFNLSNNSAQPRLNPPPTSQPASAKQKQVIDFFESIAEDSTLKSNPYQQNFDTITRTQNNNDFNLLNAFDPFSLNAPSSASSTNLTFPNTTFSQSSTQTSSNPFASLTSQSSVNTSFQSSNQSFNPVFPPVSTMNAMSNSAPGTVSQGHQRKNSQNPFSNLDFTSNTIGPSSNFNSNSSNNTQFNPFSSMTSTSPTNMSFTNSAPQNNTQANPFSFDSGLGQNPPQNGAGANTFNPIFPPPQQQATANQNTFNPF
jgi:hypothetical protein